MTDKQRISYVPLEDMTDDMRTEMERCAREGTPRPESSAVRAHVPAAFWFFANGWDELFRNGVCDHEIKELLLQTAVYCGVPTANTAFREARDVIAELAKK